MNLRKIVGALAFMTLLGSVGLATRAVRSIAGHAEPVLSAAKRSSMRTFQIPRGISEKPETIS